MSTVIPAYNAERFIARALESALAQNIPRSEIIVVDDGSADRTCEVVEDYGVHGVRLLRHTMRQGVAAARNTGILAAKGEYVAFLDADDAWQPQKLARQLDVIAANPAMTFVSCRATLIDETGLDRGDIYRGAAPALGIDAWRTLLTYPCVATPTVVARRSAIMNAGLFNRWLRVCEDQDMWIRLSLQGEVGYVAEDLVRVHSTPNSLSKTKIRDQAGYVFPMVAAYLARNSARLTRAQRRKILGERFSKIGQSAYANGEHMFGLRTILRAIAHGHRPVHNLIYLIRASAVVQRLKRALLRIPA